MSDFTDQQVFLHELIAEAALDDRVSESQLETLIRWRDIDDTPNEEYRESIRVFIGCLDLQGIDAGIVEDARGGDYPETTYAVYGSQPMEASDPCMYQEIWYIDQAYQLGDGVTQTRMRREEEYLPEAVACLTDLGFDVPEDATFRDLEELVPDTDEDGTVCMLLPGRWGF
ncbi:hypothetical protein [Demequina sediminicola]|uniref:hypothetical protein n=1 Tax=Demequina sediminicola TaxID=1095026 RepID=UPI00128D1211|nr:hypothetical protein [Demequina sediminicola]